MKQEIEIEFKTLITKEHFDKLKNNLPFPTDAIKQVNYYFETKDFQLKAHRSAIRIRQKNDAYILTLKQPHTEGILETHETLTKKEFTAFLQGNIIQKQHIDQQLKQFSIDMRELVYFGALTTYRSTFKEAGIEYVLDESHYGNVIDYELELEAPSTETGEKSFHTLLEKFSIPRQVPITKIERFFKEKERHNQSDQT